MRRVHRQLLKARQHIEMAILELDGEIEKINPERSNGFGIEEYARLQLVLIEDLETIKSRQADAGAMR